MSEDYLGGESGSISAVETGHGVMYRICFKVLLV
jgi:hypothetical protein